MLQNSQGYHTLGEVHRSSACVWLGPCNGMAVTVDG